MICGTDADSGGGASAWEVTTTPSYLPNTITPTTSEASIVVLGTATTTKLVVTSPNLGEQFVQISHDGTDASIVQNTGELQLGVAGQTIYLDSPFIANVTNYR